MCAIYDTITKEVKVGDVVVTKVDDQEAFVQYMERMKTEAEKAGRGFDKHMQEIAEEIVNFRKFSKKYKDAIDYNRLYKVKIDEVIRLYGKQGKALFNKVENTFAEFMAMGKSRNWIRQRQLVSGMSHSKHPNLVITKTNFPKKELDDFTISKGIRRANEIDIKPPTINEIKSIYRHFGEELHPYMESLISEYLKKRSTVNMSPRALMFSGGHPGIHAEVRALNELFFELEKRKMPISDFTLKNIIGYNKKMPKEEVMVRCGDCFFLTSLVKMIGLN